VLCVMKILATDLTGLRDKLINYDLC